MYDMIVVILKMGMREVFPYSSISYSNCMFNVRYMKYPKIRPYDVTKAKVIIKNRIALSSMKVAVFKIYNFHLRI